MADDPLEMIFVKPEQVEGEKRAQLAKMIFPFAYIDAENGRIHFKATADELNAKQKVLVYLLCRLALSTRTDSKFPASVSPKEVEIDTGIPGGTIRPKLSQLVEEHKLIRRGDGYMVSTEHFDRIFKELESFMPEG